MSHIKIKTEDDNYSHEEYNDGKTLCGLEMDGDSGLGIEIGNSTKQKINCPHCIENIKHCWEIDKKEIA